MENIEKLQREILFRKIINSPVRLFLQDEIPRWKKNGLGILLALFTISAVLLVINVPFFRVYDDYFLYQYGITAIIFLLSNFSIVKLMAMYEVKTKENPSYKNLFLLVGSILDKINSSERVKITQGDISSHISENYPIKDMGKRKMDGVFSDANKLFEKHKKELEKNNRS